MLRFRPSLPPADHSGGPAAALSLGQVRRLAADALARRHFFVAGGIALEEEHAPAEDIPWEVFQGRLLDAAHSRRRQTFEAWNLFLIEDGNRSAEPLLSIKLDAAAGLLHVVRAIHCYVWEGYHAGDNVYLSRETRKWVRELVGTIPLNRFLGEDDLRDELICQVFHAVVGTSRLPLTSVEAPLPAFSLGRLAYFYHRGEQTGPACSSSELIDRLFTAELSWREKAKLLETLLRAVPSGEMVAAVRRFMGRWRQLGHEDSAIIPLLRTLFNEVSLSPYTDFVDKALAFIHLLVEERHLATPDVVDLFGQLLRLIGRHLTAYDLVVFHHRGANYPDALLLDLLLRTYLAAIASEPALFLDAPGDTEVERKRKRLRRRALRQGWLLRRRYEGHLVPDTPTSEGENVRVLPPPFPHLPAEQILYPHRRTKRLYAGEPLPDLTEEGRAALRQSIHDLHHPHELRELGMALFLDRPLGGAKGPVEPDQTPLLSYEAFSLTIARRRLEFLAQNVNLVEPTEFDILRRQARDDLKVRGIPVDTIESAARPGTVSLADARRAADDFVLLRTTAQTATAFLALFDWRPLAARFALDWLAPDRPLLIVGGPAGKGQAEIVLRLYDSNLHPRLELTVDVGGGYACRGGIEYPVNGLRPRRAWEEEGGADRFREHDLTAAEIRLRPGV